MCATAIAYPLRCSSRWISTSVIGRAFRARTASAAERRCLPRSGRAFGATGGIGGGPPRCVTPEAVHDVLAVDAWPHHDAELGELGADVARARRPVLVGRRRARWPARARTAHSAWKAANPARTVRQRRGSESDSERRHHMAPSTRRTAFGEGRGARTGTRCVTEQAQPTDGVRHSPEIPSRRFSERFSATGDAPTQPAQPKNRLRDSP